MKIILKSFLSLLLIGITLSAFSQDNATVVLSYKKVPPGFTMKYLEFENEWKDIHKERLEKGHITGWQLWEKMYSGAGDEYQYITITWYKNFQGTNETGLSEIIKQRFTEEELESLESKTTLSGMAVRKDVMHRAAATAINDPTKYIVVSPMKVSPGKETEYLEMEREIFKPIHEEAVRMGLMGSWSVWYKWPFEADDERYVVINGFEDYSQLSALDYEELFKKVHPEADMDEVWEKTAELRTNTSVQIWRLIDSVYKNESHE
jgi:hypothetical protein